MSNAPLMPMATAVWLVENTSLTFRQIADFCKLHEVEIQGIADGEVAKAVSFAVQQVLLLADDFYQSGTAGLSYLPLRAHIAIAVAARVYRQIGMQIAATGYSWHQGRQVTSRVTKIICSLRACGSSWRRFWPRTPHRKHLHDGLEGLPYVR